MGTQTPPPIVKKFSHTIFRDGRTRRECWSAETVDGLWAFDRLEMSGTPWSIMFLPLRVEVGWAGTLKAARKIAASMTTADVIKIRGETV